MPVVFVYISMHFLGHLGGHFARANCIPCGKKEIRIHASSVRYFSKLHYKCTFLSLFPVLDQNAKLHYVSITEGQKIKQKLSIMLQRHKKLFSDLCNRPHCTDKFAKLA